MSDKLNIILNGKKIEGIKGETILKLANRHGIEIPTLCNDPRLEPFSSCFVCVVEVEGMKGMQPSCSTYIREGMVINTENDTVRKARKMSLDLLVSNHYADCLAPCKQTCPAGVDVQGYISMIEKGKYHDAVALIKETNPFPAVCGRVCVRPCEVACRRNLLNEDAPVGIDYLKRYASDIDLNSPDKFVPDIKPASGKKVAVIGGGPGGMSSAFFLRKEGHDVDVFEAATYAGGWLRYGIPEYRLPNDVLDQEVKNITDLGVNLYTSQRLGDNVKYKDLERKYDATVLAIGSQRGTLLGCEGEDAENVFSGINFLKEMEMTGEKMDFTGKKVAVVGGGNTAMDCCRTSLRCGAEKVYVIYRRTEKEMPANPIEIHESKLEGVEYMFLTNPKKVNKDERGKLKSVTCLKMELGEPDKSGRRRPIPVEGSEFDIELDYILAAIGQKTDVNFLDNINKDSQKGELKLNRWGDIDVDEATLQTGIENVFAAGDGVTGPATLIEAIGQARIASHSCDQYLRSEEVKPPKKEFLSKKDNFKEQVPDDYEGHYVQQEREEMPTLDPKDRVNFKEVELGYTNEEVAKHETQRCLECGCTAYYTCDLKKHSTEYEAEQQKFDGDFKEYEVDFRHPFVEFDNNKCILCSRCVRICSEVVGANALGLINRGFDSYMAPSMGKALQDTSCESCGLCITTCPTGAITENVPFKPGPVPTAEAPTICNYCSIGCKISLDHRTGFVMGVSGMEGQVNKDGNLCRFPKFGYKYINDIGRITQPMVKVNGDFKPVSFEKAFEMIKHKINEVDPDENVFFAGARLTNEELYLIQKLARVGVKTNNVNSFHYLGRGEGYRENSLANVPFDQLDKASRFYLFGSEINTDNAVAGFMVFNNHFLHNIPIEQVTTQEESSMTHKVDKQLKVKSYYHFMRAVNHFLLSSELQNQLFITDNCEGFEAYKKSLLTEDFDELVKHSGIRSAEKLQEFALDYNNEMNAVLLFSEKEVSSASSIELFNLAMITGKLGKTANGLISLKEKNNSQGLFDMGIAPDYVTGNVPVNDKDNLWNIKQTWKIDALPEKVNATEELLELGKVKNMFIFGEDPVGTAVDKAKVEKWLDKAGFKVVQDYFMTETADRADLILPASMPFETGGSFTNTQKNIQKFDVEFESKPEIPSHKQLITLLKEFGAESPDTMEEVLSEAIGLLPVKMDKDKYHFHPTTGDDENRMFNYGADSLVMNFEKYFEEAFKHKAQPVEAVKV